MLLDSFRLASPSGIHADHLVYHCSRLRAPKKSPTGGYTQGGVYDPPSPGAEITGSPPSPSAPKPLYMCPPFVKAALVKGSFKTIVAPPKYVDVNEWVAINRQPSVLSRIHSAAPYSCSFTTVFDFYHNLNHFYGVLTDFCTPTNCPTMSAGPT